MKKLSEKVVNRQRQLVLEMLDMLVPFVLEEGHPADRVLARFFKNRRELGSRDRRFLSEAFFSYFRWLGWTRKLKLNLLDSVALSVHLDSEEVHPALFREGWSPLGEKSLDEKKEIVNSWFEYSIEKSDLLPPVIGKSIELPPGCEPTYFETLQQRPSTWVRVRNKGFKKVLAEANIPFEEHEVLENAVSIPAGRPLGALRCVGQYEVQDIASQAVVAVCAPENGSDWWDSCAGAGGKALHLADVVGWDGKIFATDMREKALSNCKKRARTDGVRNIRIQRHDLAKDDPFTKMWDGVLVDAPCSGWGTWSRSPDARWRTDMRDPTQKRNLQKRMLLNAASCVKLGGVLVYAVCTITKEETSQVVEAFLNEREDFSFDKFNNPMTGNPINGALQIWPWNGPGDGMFIAKFRRECDV